MSAALRIDAPPGPEPVIELEIAAADLPRLLRSPILAPLRRGRTRTLTCRRIWHDTPALALRGHSLALSEQAGIWRLERLDPDDAATWPPGAPPPILEQGSGPGLPHRRLTPSLLGALAPIAAFTGTRRSLSLRLDGAPAALDILEGTLRGVAEDQSACRLILSGPPAQAAALAGHVATLVKLHVPRTSLAAAAIAHATALPPRPRQLGAPEIPHGVTVSGALALVTAHLADVILHWAASIPPETAPSDPEPVHQMRVAVRRLRSALAIFRRAVDDEHSSIRFKELGAELKSLAALLGAARDWDVFLADAGTAIASSFPGDRRIATLLNASSRKRQGAYAALHAHFASMAWRDFAMRLALLPTARPWLRPSQQIAPDSPPRNEFGEPVPPDAPSASLTAPAAAYAAQALQRAFRRTIAAGDDLSLLSPEALHDARKQAKRLRYACEFFAPLFPAKPTRRFLQRLEDVQEALGAVNDGHVAASLMAQLSPGGEGRFATGVVQGYIAAASAPAAPRAAKAWAKLLRQDVFWA